MLNYLNQFRPSTAQPHPKPQLALLIYLGSLQQPRCRLAHWRERPRGSSLLALSIPTGAATASILSRLPLPCSRGPCPGWSGPAQTSCCYRDPTICWASRAGTADGRALSSRGVMPDRQAPLPPSLRTATRAAYLAGKVRAKAVPGLDPDVVDVPQPDGSDPHLVPPTKRSDSQWLPVCPAYLCRAEVRRTDSGTYVVDATLATSYSQASPLARSSSPGYWASIASSATTIRPVSTLVRR